LERSEEDRMPKNIFTQELEGMRRRGRLRKGWRKEVERDFQVLGVRRWTELVIDREMERYCSTGQSPQRAVAPTEEEELYIYRTCEFGGSYSGINEDANPPICYAVSTRQ
jgi:hypothetical protein